MVRRIEPGPGFGLGIETERRSVSAREQASFRDVGVVSDGRQVFHDVFLQIEKRRLLRGFFRRVLLVEVRQRFRYGFVPSLFFRERPIGRVFLRGGFRSGFSFARTFRYRRGLGRLLADRAFFLSREFPERVQSALSKSAVFSRNAISAHANPRLNEDDIVVGGFFQ